MPTRILLTNCISLITFNNSSPQPHVRREASTPQVYNVTQNFAATAGVSYTFSAFAALAPIGDTTPHCSISICGNDACSASVDITSKYSPYTYQYNAESTEAGAVAIFSVQCDKSAYVALDNVKVTSSGRSITVSSQATATVTHFVTQTEQHTSVLTQTRTTSEIGPPSTQIYSVTNTKSTVLWSTATHTVAETMYINVTVSDLSITTSKFDLSASCVGFLTSVNLFLLTCGKQPSLRFSVSPQRRLSHH